MNIVISILVAFIVTLIRYSVNIRSYRINNSKFNYWTAGVTEDPLKSKLFKILVLFLNFIVYFVIALIFSYILKV